MKMLLMSLLTISTLTTSSFASEREIIAPAHSQDQDDSDYSTLLMEDIGTSSSSNNNSGLLRATKVRHKKTTTQITNTSFDTHSTTPIFFALRTNRFNVFFELVKKAVENNVPLMPQNEHKQSFLHEAILILPLGEIEILFEIVKSNGVDINTQTYNGITFLHNAVLKSQDNLSVIKWLINKGARTDLSAMINGKACLPLTIALTKDNLTDAQEIIDLLSTGLTAEQIKEATDTVRLQLPQQTRSSHTQ